MADIATLSVLLTLKDELTAKLQASQGRIREFSRNMTEAGRGLVTLGAPLAALGGLGVKAAIDFESSFAGIRKTVDATEAEFAQLSRGMRNMAQQIPVNVNELNRIGEAAGQLGIETKNILQFTRVMADLGVTTNLSSDQAATALARLANITQMPQNQFDRLGSTIVALGNNLATTEAEITEMGLRLAGAGHQIGLSQAQILALAGALSSLGIEAQAGGSAMSRVMVALAQEVERGGVKLELFARVAGMTSREFATAFRQDASMAIVAFTEGLGRMSEEGENVFGVLDELGLSEVRVRDALLRAAGAGDVMRQSLGLASQAWAENTALTSEASKRYETAASQFALLKNKIQELLITVGEGLVPVLVDMAEALSAILGPISRFAAEHKTLTLIAVGVSTAIVGIGTALIGLGLILPGVTAAVKLFGITAATASGPVGWLALAIGAAATAGTLLGNKIRDLRNDTSELGKSVKPVTEEFIKFQERMRSIGMIQIEPGKFVPIGSQIAQDFLKAQPPLHDFNKTAKQTQEAINTLTSGLESLEGATEIWRDTLLTTNSVFEGGHIALTQHQEDILNLAAGYEVLNTSAGEATAALKSSSNIMFQASMGLRPGSFQELVASVQKNIPLAAFLPQSAALERFRETTSAGVFHLLPQEEQDSLIATIREIITEARRQLAILQLSPEQRAIFGGTAIQEQMPPVGVFNPLSQEEQERFNTASIEAMIEAMRRLLGISQFSAEQLSIVGGTAMQHGGIVNRPTMALIGERGPEAVIPLSGGGMRNTINIQFMGSVYGFDDFQERVTEAVRDAKRRGGFDQE